MSNPSSFVSSYGITLKEDGKTEVFPAVQVFFQSRTGEWLSIFLVIDSGATISALPKTDASIFGIDVERGDKIMISGIGNEVLVGWQHKVTVRLGGELIRLPVVFLDKETTPRVLGRAGVFEHFVLIFEENQHRTGFIKENQPESKTVRKILNRFKSI